jgi:hypothetical protein
VQERAIWRDVTIDCAGATLWLATSLVVQVGVERGHRRPHYRAHQPFQAAGRRERHGLTGARGQPTGARFHPRQGQGDCGKNECEQVAEHLAHRQGRRFVTITVGQDGQVTLSLTASSL